MKTLCIFSFCLFNSQKHTLLSTLLWKISTKDPFLLLYRPTPIPISLASDNLTFFFCHSFLLTHPHIRPQHLPIHTIMPSGFPAFRHDPTTEPKYRIVPSRQAAPPYSALTSNKHDALLPEYASREEAAVPSRSEKHGRGRGKVRGWVEKVRGKM